MYKRLIPIGLLLSVSLLLSACGPGSGTEPDTERETDTGTHESTGTSAPTSPPDDGPWDEVFAREDARTGFIAWALDDFRLNGSAYFDEDGRADRLLDAVDHTVSFGIGDRHDTASFGGWIGFDQPIDLFGYCVDGGRCVFGDFSAETGAEAKTAGGRHASRFAITVPLIDQGAGSHTVSALVRLADGKIVSVCDVTVVIRTYSTDPARTYHAVIDHVNGAGTGGADCLSGVISSTLTGDGGCPEVRDVLPCGADGILAIDGWLGAEGGIDRYIWTVDGARWFDCIDLGTTDGSPELFKSIGIPDVAPEKAVFRIGADLSAYSGQLVSVTFAAVYAADPACIVPIILVNDVKVPFIPVDIGWSFRADAALSAAGTDLAYTGLSGTFAIGYGASGPHDVQKEGGEAFYEMAGINEIYAAVNGRNAYTVDIRYDEDLSAMMFTRGVHAVHPIDTTGIQIVLNNYYETDWTGYMGGAGIWCQLSEGKLSVLLKYYDPTVLPRIGNKIYEFPASGSKVTLADDGGTVYVMVDGKLITKIMLSGEVTYPDMVWSTEAAGFAASASIVKADGSIEVLTNTLIASAPSQVGIAVRPGLITFRSVEIVPFSDVTIPGQ